MTDAFPVLIPLLNPNEPGALLTDLHVSPGLYVKAGERLCTLETTKSTNELCAESAGYVVGLTYQAGQTIQAGEILCYLADSPDWLPPDAPPPAQEKSTPAPTGLRISQPALLLAQQHNLDLSLLPGDVFITEKMIQDRIDHLQKTVPILKENVFSANSIIIFGGGGHGKALIDLIRILGTYPIAGIVDDDPALPGSIMGVPVLGGGDVLEQLIEHGVHLAVNAVGGIGNIQSRIKVFERLAREGFSCPALIHPTAFVESSARLADGVQVMPHAYVGSEARIGFGTIINTGAIVSHDCVINDYANLSPGAILAGEVHVGEATLVGMGVTVNLRVRLGSHARIGNGATVKQDVPEGSVVHAGATWPA